MKELVSYHDDAEKRLGIFFGLGAFLLSSVLALFQGLSAEAMLLRGVVVLTLSCLMGWAYGLWLKDTLEKTKPEEELPSNMERRSRNAENLDEGALITLPGTETILEDDPNATPATGQVVNFTLPELSPMDTPLQGATPPPRNAAPAAAPAPVAVKAAEDEGDLPPPAVPSWLK